MYILHFKKRAAIVCEKEKFARSQYTTELTVLCYTVAVWYKAQLNWEQCLLSLNSRPTTLNRLLA